MDFYHTLLSRSLKSKDKELLSYHSNPSLLLIMNFIPVSKPVLVHNLSYGNEFDLQDNEYAKKSHFNMKGSAPRLVLKQRYQQRDDLFNVN